jgi:hypothetical protein
MEAIFMSQDKISLEQNTPDLLGAAQAAFNVHDQFQTHPKGKDYSPDSWCKIFDPYGLIGNHIRRGQAFGFFTENVSVERGVQIEKIWDDSGALPVRQDKILDCVTLEIDYPYHLTTDRQVSMYFRIYKEETTGLYYTGNPIGNTLNVDHASKDGLSEADMYMRTFEWCKNFATEFPQKRMALMNTMSDKDFPAPSMAYQIARAAFKELTAYLHRTFC